VLSWQEPWIDVIKKEISVFEPDVVIFFTGPNYDDIMKDVFGPLALSPVHDDFSVRQLARVESESLPTLSFRTYHPNYLWRFGFQGVHDAILQPINR
jgi:hypothetical protein